MQDKVFDKNIRDKVQAFDPLVPKDIWANIEAGLDQQPAIPLNQGKSKFFWLRVAAAILFFIGAGMFYINRPREVIYLTASNKKENTKVVVSAKQIAAEQEPSGGEKVNKAVKTVTQPLVVGQHEIYGENNKQEEVLASLEETNLTASAPAFEHPILIEEVKRPELSALYSGAQEEDLANVFIDEQPGLLVLTREPAKYKKRFGVSDLLNYVVRPVNQGEQKVLSFANDEEGSIRVALNLKALKIKL